MLSTLTVLAGLVAAGATYAARGGFQAGVAFAALALAAGGVAVASGAPAAGTLVILAGLLAAWLLAGLPELESGDFGTLTLRLGGGVAAVGASLSLAAALRLGPAVAPVVTISLVTLGLGVARFAGRQGAEGTARAGALALLGLSLLEAALRPTHSVAVLLISVSVPVWVLICRERTGAARATGLDRPGWRLLSFAGVAQGALAFLVPGSATVAGVRLSFSASGRWLVLLTAAGLLAIAVVRLLRVPAPRPAGLLGIAATSLLIVGLSDPVLWLGAWVAQLGFLVFTWHDRTPITLRILLLPALAVAAGEMLASAAAAGIAGGRFSTAAGVLVVGGLALLLGVLPGRGSVAGLYPAADRAALAWWLLMVPALAAVVLRLAAPGGRLAGAAFLLPLLAVLGGFTALVAAIEAVAEVDLMRMAEQSGRFAVGLMLVGIASGRPLGVAGGLLLGIDLCLGRPLFAALAELASRRTGSTAVGALPEALPPQARLRGALLMGLAALGGVPPFVGFAARVLIYRAAFDSGWPAGLLALAAGALWLYASLRLIGRVAVLPPRPRPGVLSHRALALAWLPATLALALGLQPGRLARWLVGSGG